ncbi:MAG TPA: lytic transglycosylase domain-containing protein [Xanthomonadaceae bacterium]|nr:lytic transglycosylase domain-containing protein [Xanthomonadaceae bacterium]
MRAGLLAAVAVALSVLVATPAPAQSPAGDGAPHARASAGPGAVLLPHERSGAEIYAEFRAGLAEPACPAGSASPRWSRHFSAAAVRLSEKDETLALFGYVVDALRASDLPTEYALIPFVESGYKPGARSQLGPAGLWQFITMTARNHDVPVRDGFDGRLSPVESTRAAVRYLKTLHGMFAGDWRLAAMAYNAGEYRLFGALRRSGQVARSADHEKLVGLSGITRAYPRKIHAISCLLQQADDDPEWLASLDRPVSRLVAVALPTDARDLDRWARDQGLDPARVRRLNPAYRNGRVVRRGSEPMQVLAPATPAVEAVETVTVADATAMAPDPAVATQGEVTTAVEARPDPTLPD